MSLEKTKGFLILLNSAFNIFDKRHHSIMLEGDKIMLQIHVGESWRTFILSDEDLTKDPQEIITEIQNLMKEI